MVVADCVIHVSPAKNYTYFGTQVTFLSQGVYVIHTQRLT